jgi:hypothetical protein
MTTNRGPTVEAIPNVLQDQTVPNTLRGMLPPAPVVSRWPSRGVLVVIAAAVAAVAALLVARLA